DAAQRVRAKDGRMCAGAGDDADQLDVETEQGVQEGQAVVGRKAGEEHSRTTVALRLALRRGQLAAGVEAEGRLGPEVGRGRVEPGGGGGHVAIVQGESCDSCAMARRKSWRGGGPPPGASAPSQTAPVWTDGLLPWYARHGRHQ